MVSPTGLADASTLKKLSRIPVTSLEHRHPNFVSMLSSSGVRAATGDRRGSWSHVFARDLGEAASSRSMVSMNGSERGFARGNGQSIVEALRCVLQLQIGRKCQFCSIVLFPRAFSPPMSKTVAHCRDEHSQPVRTSLEISAGHCKTSCKGFRRKISN